jgi:hypothetical protein
MSDRETSLKTLRRVQNVRLVQHSSGRYAEVGEFKGGIISLRVVRDDYLPEAQRQFDAAAKRIADQAPKRAG